MYYLPEQFEMLDEAHALSDSLQDLAPKLYETLNAARADLLNRYPADLFWANQNNANMPRLVNQRCARIWNDDSWVLSDKCGYLHLTENASGLRAILRRVDPVTGKLPKTNATKASRAYYMQSTCKGAGALRRLSQDSLFAPEGAVSPDLSDTRLILAWQEKGDAVSVTAYRPLTVVSYGDTDLAKKYDFSLELLDKPMEVRDFTPIEDNDDNLLPNLVLDDISENETVEIQAEQ